MKENETTSTFAEQPNGLPLSTLKKKGNANKKLQALLIDDNSINAFFLQKMLERFQVESEVKVNGSEGICAMKLKKYDAIFLDIEMPEMNGWEVLRWLQVEHPENANNTSCMFIYSALPLPVVEKNCPEGLYFDRVLSKPFLPSQLTEIMKIVNP